MGFGETSLLDAHRRGVRAFDLDLIFSSDDILYVGHPDDFRANGIENPFEKTSAQVDSSPNAALRVSRLLEIATALGANLTLALDLKGGGRAGYGRALGWLHSEVLRLQLERSVWLWVSVHAEARRLRKRELQIAQRERGPTPRGWGHAVRLGKPLYDVGAPQRKGRSDCSGNVEEGDADVYAFLGPSLRCANENLFGSPRVTRFHDRPTGWLVWVIDEATQLVDLRDHLAVRQVVSNVPLALRAAVDAASGGQCGDR